MLDENLVVGDSVYSIRFGECAIVTVHTTGEPKYSVRPVNRPAGRPSSAGVYSSGKIHESDEFPSYYTSEPVIHFAQYEYRVMYFDMTNTVKMSINFFVDQAEFTEANPGCTFISMNKDARQVRPVPTNES